MWEIERTPDFDAKYKWFEKKRPRELRAMLSNLDTVFKTLLAGTKPAQVKFGFIHPEPRGVWGIDQKGGGTYLKQTRPYVFAHEPTETLHALTIGDKASQAADIATCTAFVDGMTKQGDQRKGEGT